MGMGVIGTGSMLEVLIPMVGDAFPLDQVGADPSMGLWCPHTTPR